MSSIGQFSIKKSLQNEENFQHKKTIYDGEVHIMTRIVSLLQFHQ
jgi:hypothetical protein